MTSRTSAAVLRNLSKNVQRSRGRPFRITPPPPPVQQIRTFLGRRSTSFYTHSYPPVTYSGEIPYVPPGPSSSNTSPGPGDAASDNGLPVEGKRKERKERYLESLMDKAGELSLRCSILDSSGDWRAEEGRYKKTELCREHDLDPRDLRKLDSLTPNLVPLILTRRSCILVSMLHIRALIKPDRIIVFDSAGSTESEVSRKFKWHLERNIKAGLAARVEEEMECEEEDIGLVYEHRALESILVATSNALEEEMGYTRTLVRDLLVDLEDDINRDNLKRLLHYSRRMAGFQSRARYVKQAVDEVLESDEDLSAMYITARAMGRPRSLHDHEQLELLLESFVKQVEEIVSEVDTTVANMQSTQEIAELMLDSGRNALLALDIKVSIATLGVGTGALIAGFFGMNLSTQLEQTDYAFLAVTGAASTIAFIVFLLGSRILRKVRRVALSGRGAPSLRLLAVPMRRGSHNPWTPSAIPKPQGLISRIFKRNLRNPHLHIQVRRLGLFERIFRRKASRRFEHIQTSDPSEPIWINEKADQARARDAFIAGWSGKAAPKDWDEVRTVFKEFDEDWRAGKLKGKWVKE